MALFKSKDSGYDPALNIRNVAASFQAAVVDMLADKTLAAAKESGADRIVIAGGVAANSSLRNRMQEETAKRGLGLFLPRMGLCIDNAAMVALAGYLHYQQGDRSVLDLNPRASMPLGN